MANYNNLKTGIDAVIKTNGRQEISGAALNAQLKNMITELGAGYQYMGVATPAANPGTPDANVFYLASGAGTYTNFGGIVINEGEVCALVWNGTWTKEVTGVATADQLGQLGQKVDGNIQIFNRGGLTATGTENNVIRYFELEGGEYVLHLENWNKTLLLDALKVQLGYYPDRDRNQTLVLLFQINGNESSDVNVAGDYPFVVPDNSELRLVIRGDSGQIANYEFWNKNYARQSELDEVSQELGQQVSDLDLEVNGGTTTEQVIVESNYPNQYFTGNPAVVGNTYDQSPIALQGTMAYKLPVSAGDKYIIYGLGETQALPLCVITDSSHIITQIIRENSRANGRTVEIQESGTLFINLYNYSASTDKVLREVVVQEDGLVSRVSDLETETTALGKSSTNKKSLFLPDSDFSKELTGVIDYYATEDVDATKEYYLKICGYRENNKAQTIIRIDDGDGTIVEQITWNATVSKVYKVMCAGFVFLVDSATLPNNSTDAFIIYNFHLNKFSSIPQIDKEFVENVATPGLRWLKRPFANNIAETKVIDSLIYISARNEIPSGLYIRYFGRKTGDNRLYIQICNSENTEVSSYLGALPTDLDVEQVVTTTGTYTFDIKLLISKTDLGNPAFTNFQSYALNLDDVYLNAQLKDGGAIAERVAKLENEQGFLEGKRIVCFGDSITMFKGTGDKTYSDWLQEFSGATVVNCGFGGSRLTSRTTPVASPTTSTEAFAPFDISNLIEFISANDYSKLDAGLQWIINNETQWLSSQFSANLANVKSIDWSNVDVVTIFAGTNDKSAGATIGVSADDNKSTIMGAVKLISRVLLTAFPHLKIYWFTPIIRYYCDTVEERTPETFSDNSNLPDYVDAILTQSRNLKFPACDLYRTLGWNEYNFSEYFLDNDGTHPYKGFKDIGLKIDKFLQSN